MNHGSWSCLRRRKHRTSSLSDLPGVFSSGRRAGSQQFARDSARLRGANARTGANLKFYCLRKKRPTTGGSCCAPAKAPASEHKVVFHEKTPTTPICAIVVEVNDEGHRRLQFPHAGHQRELERLGEVPLHPTSPAPIRMTWAKTGSVIKPFMPGLTVRSRHRPPDCIHRELLDEIRRARR